MSNCLREWFPAHTGVQVFWGDLKKLLEEGISALRANLMGVRVAATAWEQDTWTQDEMFKLQVHEDTGAQR